jgi:hypothetical protein
MRLVFAIFGVLAGAMASAQDLRFRRNITFDPSNPAESFQISGLPTTRAIQRINIRLFTGAETDVSVENTATVSVNGRLSLASSATLYYGTIGGSGLSFLTSYAYGSKEVEIPLAAYDGNTDFTGVSSATRRFTASVAGGGASITNSLMLFQIQTSGVLPLTLVNDSLATYTTYNFRSGMGIGATTASSTGVTAVVVDIYFAP